MGYIAKHCLQLSSSEVTVNCASTSRTKENKWFIDSAASHNITSDLANLSIHTEYDGTNEVVIGDGSSLSISHIGFRCFTHPTVLSI